MNQNLQIIKQQLSGLEEKLAIAQREKNEAGVTLANDPSNPSALSNAREANSDINLIKNSLWAAEDAAKNQEIESNRLDAVKYCKQAKSALAKRTECAKHIDDALAKLSHSVSEWLKANDLYRGSAINFYKALDGDRYIASIGDVSSVALQGIVQEIHKAINPMAWHHHMSFIYTDSGRTVYEDAQTSSNLQMRYLEEFSKKNNLSD